MPPPAPTLLPYTTLFRSRTSRRPARPRRGPRPGAASARGGGGCPRPGDSRSEEDTSEVQAPDHLVSRRLLEKKQKLRLRRLTYTRCDDLGLSHDNCNVSL